MVCLGLGSAMISAPAPAGNFRAPWAARTWRYAIMLRLDQELLSERKKGQAPIYFNALEPLVWTTNSRWRLTKHHTSFGGTDILLSPGFFKNRTSDKLVTLIPSLAKRIDLVIIRDTAC